MAEDVVGLRADSRMHELPRPTPQFVSLPDALCDIVATLHKVRQPTRLDNVHAMLRRQYLGMAIPRKETIQATLDSLTSEGRLCKMGDIYFSPWAAFNPYVLPVAPPPGHSLQPQSMMFSPYHFDWWTATGSLPRQAEGSDRISKPEVCSAECQTGASIVNAIPPYKPPAQEPLPPAVDTPLVKSDYKEKRTFIDKLFRRRSKSKTQDDAKSGKSSKTPVRSTSADSKLSNVTKGDHRTHAPPANAEAQQELRHLTFSAQFPPPEWLYRPVIAKRCDIRNRLSFIGAREPRTSEEDDVLGGNGNNNNNGVFQTWVDSMPPMHHASVNMYGSANLPADVKSRRRTGDLRFASQRAPVTIFEETEPIHVRESKRIKHKQRLSKYLSSSSECLKSVDFHVNDSTGSNSPKKRSKPKHLDHRSNFQQFKPPASTTPPAPVKYPGEKVPKSFEISPPRLMTSTPTPPEVILRSEIDEKQDEMNRRDSLQNDSALSSASPVDSGPMDRQRKYSSWSSVEEPLEHVFERSINLAPLESANHTYENLKNGDHTYENLGKSLDATKYEDITNYVPRESQEQSKKQNDIAPRISRTCVSAL